MLLLLGKLDQKTRGFRDFVNDSDIYSIFSEVYKIGAPWLNKHKNISQKLQGKYEELNPFEGKNLKSRLEQVNPQAVVNLKLKLSEDVNEYVFPCQYQQRKSARGGDNYKLEIMNFQNVFPKAGKIVPAFASEIVKQLSEYPRGYDLLNTNPNPTIDRKTHELPDASFDIPEENMTTEEYLEDYERKLQNGEK